MAIPIPLLIGAGSMAAGAAGSLLNKKKKGTNFSVKPYSGLRPQRIDTAGQEILRPTQKQYFDLVMNRSKGQDVGYDPQRRELLTNLVKSEIVKREEDDLRDTRGAVSAAGLSGNPRAYEALGGRVKRDSARTLGDELSKIAIEDLTRANEERDVNTGRLGDLNQFNFGQENKAADFDLAAWQAEQGFGLDAQRLGEASGQYGQNRMDELFGGLSEMGGTLLGSQGANKSKDVLFSNLGSSGTGISPSFKGVDDDLLKYGGRYSMPLNKTKSFRSLVR